MKAEDYNQAELVAGRMTTRHIAELVQLFQSNAGLTADGMFGPKTRRMLEKRFAPSTPTPLSLRWPMPTLKDGRKPVITSEFRPKDRPTHNGLDLFYRWKEGDKPDKPGDGGTAGTVNGHPKWGVPLGTDALAAADGVVQIAGNSKTGFRMWIDHGNGWRTGYFHMLDCLYTVGDRVKTGDRLGEIGDNPAAYDARHLHFELSPVDRYAPVDPTPYLVKQ